MEIITLSHGSGGKATNKLIDKLFYKYFNNEFLLQKREYSNAILSFFISF